MAASSDSGDVGGMPVSDAVAPRVDGVSAERAGAGPARGVGCAGGVSTGRAGAGGGGVGAGAAGAFSVAAGGVVCTGGGGVVTAGVGVGDGVCAAGCGEGCVGGCAGVADGAEPRAGGFDFGSTVARGRAGGGAVFAGRGGGLATAVGGATGAGGGGTGAGVDSGALGGTGAGAPGCTSVARFSIWVAGCWPRPDQSVNATAPTMKMPSAAMPYRRQFDEGTGGGGGSCCDDPRRDAEAEARDGADAPIVDRAAGTAASVPESRSRLSRFSSACRSEAC